MTTFPETEKALIIEMVEGKLDSLDDDFPNDIQARSRRRIYLLRILSRLDPEVDGNPSLDRVVAERNIITRRTTAPAKGKTEEAPAAPETADTPAIVSDDEEDEGDDDDEQKGEERGAPPEAPDAKEPSKKESNLQFAPGRVYRSTQVTIGNRMVAAGHGYSSDKNGGQFYTGRKGRRHNIARPPPRPCFNCGGNHWRVNCPYALGNATIV